MAWLARVRSRGIGSSVCFWSRAYTATMAMSSEMEITGTSIDRGPAWPWGAGLGGGHVGVGHEVHVGPGDSAGVGSQDDGAVHLGQLGEALGAEGGVEQ